MNDNHPPGQHILLDFYGAKNLNDINTVEQALTQAATACGATILQIKLHSFGENQGITGIAILAESHISIHTWPEIDFIALDIFTCGQCDAERAFEPLKAAFEPTEIDTKKISRGRRRNPNGKLNQNQS